MPSRLDQEHRWRRHDVEGARDRIIVAFQQERKGDPVAPRERPGDVRRVLRNTQDREPVGAVTLVQSLQKRKHLLAGRARALVDAKQQWSVRGSAPQIVCLPLRVVEFSVGKRRLLSLFDRHSLLPTGITRTDAMPNLHARAAAPLPPVAGQTAATTALTAFSAQTMGASSHQRLPVRSKSVSISAWPRPDRVLESPKLTAIVHNESASRNGPTASRPAASVNAIMPPK